MKDRPTKPPSGKLLFAAPERPANIFVAYVDGASRGNPGPASYAVILRGPDGATRFEVGKYIGRATNNVAEYYGLITALDHAAAQGIERLLVRSDSELLVRQMQGRYKVKSPDLRPLHERARKLAHGFAYFAIEHVPREQNREADELANVALDRTGSRSGGNAEPDARSGARPDAKGSASADLETGAKLGAKPSARSGPTHIARDELRVRARYSAGALHPLEGLNLSEDEIVEISIRRSPNPS
ncbi:MAG: ribonuclease HI [Acidobacteria bacterium]|nr:MAG: ribonuclease HI [Acidobacteriota bacterium]